VTAEMMPMDPRARRIALAVWIVLALLGTIAVWLLSSYINALTDLGRTDRDTAAALFKSRVVPALAGVVLIAVVAGAVVVRYGLQVMRTGRLQADVGLTPPNDRERSLRPLGIAIAAVGALMAVLPMVLLGLVLWTLR
jgi:NADH:ubiquinone oxidoreductase subunit 6 (subunit J)